MSESFQDFIAKLKRERAEKWAALGKWGRFKVRAWRKITAVKWYLHGVWEALCGRRDDE